VIGGAEASPVPVEFQERERHQTPSHKDKSVDPEQQINNQSHSRVGEEFSQLGVAVDDRFDLEYSFSGKLSRKDSLTSRSM
jgi:hypothetical protein